MAITGTNSFIEQHRLALKLSPIMVGELYLVRKLKRPIYISQNGKFVAVLNEGATPTKDLISNLIKSSHREIFVYREDIAEIKQNLENALIKVTRSLSVGNPLENGNKDLKLLSLNLAGLYQNPHSDDLLMLQYQSTQNLSKFLLENKKYQSQFFQNLEKENFHFTMSQPILSSILLLSFLQATHLFHEREIENLFLTSYLKDIGISIIPNGKLDQRSLSPRERQLFGQHADFSFDLLDGRIPLSKNYLTIVKHHHFLNDRMKLLFKKDVRAKDPELIFGIESMLVAVFDIIVAMTTDRPYRKGLSLFKALEIIKRMMADEYPQEYRALVVFIKQFFKN